MLDKSTGTADKCRNANLKISIAHIKKNSYSLCWVCLHALSELMTVGVWYWCCADSLWQFGACEFCPAQDIWERKTLQEDMKGNRIILANIQEKFRPDQCMVALAFRCSQALGEGLEWGVCVLRKGCWAAAFSNLSFISLFTSSLVIDMMLNWLLTNP